MIFFQRLKEWWTEFHHRFFYTKSEHDRVYSTVEEIFKAEIKTLLSQVEKAENLYNQTISELTELTARYKDLKDLYETEHVRYIEMEKETEAAKEEARDLLAQNMQLKQSPELNAEYLRTVQIELGRVLESMDHFGYRNQYAIPGSTCVVTGTPAKEGEIPLYARCVIDDATTKEINRADTYYEKLNVVINYVLRFGAFNRLVQTLIQSGAVQFILAYRESTTTYECFMSVNAKNFAQDATLVFDDEFGLGTIQKRPVEEEEKKEEGEG